MDESVIELLLNQPWKGNVRELMNTMERAVLMMDGDILKDKHFSFLKSFSESDSASSSGKYILKVPLEGIKIEVVLKDLILKTLDITKGNQVQAAKVLGLSRSKLRYRMEQLGIEVTRTIS